MALKPTLNEVIEFGRDTPVFQKLTGHILFDDIFIANIDAGFFQELEARFWEWAKSTGVPMECSWEHSPMTYQYRFSWQPAVDPIRCPGYND